MNGLNEFDSKDAVHTIKSVNRHTGSNIFVIFVNIFLFCIFPDIVFIIGVAAIHDIAIITI